MSRAWRQHVPALKAASPAIVAVGLAACCGCRYEPGPLERRQQRVFDPLLRWAKQELGWQLHTSSSICGTSQPDATVAAVKQYLEGAMRVQACAVVVAAGSNEL